MYESYKKLVRDKILQILGSKGVKYERREASPEEYKAELIKKLKEEIKKFVEAGSAEELADVMEVVEALKVLPEYQNAEDIRKKKFDERGGFQDRIILKGEKV